ncbi:MAG: V-type ATP synthase subunit F [Sedimentisphaeraceae bacterium JB056]
MTGKAAALGNADFVMPFTALGLSSFPVENEAEQIRESARKILEEKFSLVVVAEDVAHSAKDIFDEVDKESLPCVVVVPFTKEPEGFAVAELARALKLATGIDIVTT